MADSGGIRAGRAFVELGANDAQLQAALQRASARMQAFGQAVAGIGQKLAAAGAAGLGGFGAAVGQFTNVGEQIQRMSQRTGASVESLSALRFAAAQAGTDLETVEGALRGVQQSLVQAAQGSAEAQDKFLMLGLRARDLAKLRPDEQFVAIAEQLSKIPNPATRAARAMEVLGSAALLPLVEGGAKGLGQMAQQAQKLGLVMSGATARQAAMLAEDLRRLSQSAQFVAVGIGGALAPVLRDLLASVQPVLTRVINWVQENKSAAIAVAGLAAGVTTLGVGLTVAGIGITFAGKALGALLAPIAIVKAGLLGLLGVAKLAVVALASPLLIKGALIAGAGVAVAGAVKGLTAPRPQGDDSSASARALGGIQSVSTQVWQSVATGATRAWQAVAITGKDAWESVSTTAVSAWQGISNAIEAGRFDLVIEVMSAAVSLEWTKLTGFLSTSWAEVVASVTDLWYDAQDALTEGIYQVKVAWINVTSFLVGDWEGTVGKLTEIWDRFWRGMSEGTAQLAETIKAAIGPLMKFFESKAGKALLLTMAPGSAAILGATGVATGDEATEQQRQERLEKAKAQRNIALIDSRQDRRDDMKNRRDDVLGAEGAAAARRMEAEERLRKAQEEAQRAMAQKRQEQAAKLPTPDLGAFNRKVDVQGTFNAAVAGMLGGSTVNERLVQNGQTQIQKLEQIKRAIEQWGGPVAVA